MRTSNCNRGIHEQFLRDTRMESDSMASSLEQVKLKEVGKSDGSVTELTRMPSTFVNRAAGMLSVTTTCTSLKKPKDVVPLPGLSRTRLMT